jgi:hypothetical protein
MSKTYKFQVLLPEEYEEKVNLLLKCAADRGEEISRVSLCRQMIDHFLYHAHVSRQQLQPNLPGSITPGTTQAVTQNAESSL